MKIKEVTANPKPNTVAANACPHSSPFHWMPVNTPPTAVPIVRNAAIRLTIFTGFESNIYGEYEDITTYLRRPLMTVYWVR
jgi:hypothetical protein